MAEKVTKRPNEDKSAKPKRASSVARKSPAAEAAVPEAPAAVPVPKPVMATVDLLEPKKKVKRAEGTQKAPLKPFVVPIAATGILAPVAPAKIAEPPAPVAPEPAAAEEPVGEPESDKKVLHLKPPIIVKDLAEQLGLKPFQLIKDLMALQIFANINQTVEPDIAAKVCELHGFVFER